MLRHLTTIHRWLTGERTYRVRSVERDREQMQAEIFRREGFMSNQEWRAPFHTSGWTFHVSDQDTGRMIHASGLRSVEIESKKMLAFIDALESTTRIRVRDGHMLMDGTTAGLKRTTVLRLETIPLCELEERPPSQSEQPVGSEVRT